MGDEELRTQVLEGRYYRHGSPSGKGGYSHCYLVRLDLPTAPAGDESRLYVWVRLVGVSTDPQSRYQ